jgi:hypothetical protein
VTNIKEQFYSEIRENINDFVQYALESIKSNDQMKLSHKQLSALETVVRDVIVGALHSTFVSIDGGTALSDDGKALDLIVRKTGQPLTDGALHEEFMG